MWPRPHGARNFACLDPSDEQGVGYQLSDGSVTVPVAKWLSKTARWGRKSQCVDRGAMRIGERLIMRRIGSSYLTPFKITMSLVVVARESARRWPSCDQAKSMMRRSVKCVNWRGLPPAIDWTQTFVPLGST